MISLSECAPLPSGYRWIHYQLGKGQPVLDRIVAVHEGPNTWLAIIQGYTNPDGFLVTLGIHRSDRAGHTTRRFEGLQGATSYVARWIEMRSPR